MPTWFMSLWPDGPNSGTGFRQMFDDTLAQKQAFKLPHPRIQNIITISFFDLCIFDWNGYVPNGLQGSL